MTWLKFNAPDILTVALFVWWLNFRTSSLFATTNAFSYIIYDESDEASKMSDSVTGAWPYPGSSTGFINVARSQDC